jgi:hypothetical protein
MGKGTCTVHVGGVSATRCGHVAPGMRPFGLGHGDQGDLFEGFPNAKWSMTGGFIDVDSLGHRYGRQTGVERT